MEAGLTFRDLIFKLLRRWRTFILAACIFALIFGLFRVAKGIQDVKNSENPQSGFNLSQAAIERYKIDKKTLENDFESKTEELKNNTEYLEKSVLMNIDPYNVGEATATLYIDNHYTINPNIDYQNVNKISLICETYKAYSANESLYKHAKEKTSLNVDDKYFRELISFSVNDAGTIKIVVKSDNKDTAKKILDSVVDFFLSKKSEVAQTFGEHDLSVLNVSVTNKMDLDLLNLQNSTKKTGLSISTALNDLETNLFKLKEPEEVSISLTSILKSSIRYVIVGGIMGIVVVGLILLLMEVMSNKLRSEKDLINRYHMKVLAHIELKK